MTIKDISAQTGYSVGTVSRVLNNQPNVSEKARKIILEAASASGFQLNANAKQLKQQHSNSILVVVKGTSNELFGSLLEALQAKTADWPYPLIVDYMDEDGDEVQRAVHLCREKKPLGILFLGGNPRNFRESFHQINIPCVLVTGVASALLYDKLSSVSTDDIRAGYLAISQLVELGHRQIAVIGGVRGVSETSSRRYEGCLQAMAEHNLSFDPEQDYGTGRFNYLDGYRAVEQLLQRGRKFTAIFAMADVMAIGAIRALADSGLRVPEDVSVVGVDGLVIGNFISPRLATISQSVEELANRSVQLLREQFEEHSDPRHITIAPTFSPGESIRPL